MTTLKQITELEFDEQFTILENHLDDNAGFSGCLYETFGEELDYAFEMSKTNRVLTVIECDADYDEDIIDDGSDEYYEKTRGLTYYVTGFHLVNRLGFLILDKPYEFEFEVKID
jgi:hypothetical protein